MLVYTYILVVFVIFIAMNIDFVSLNWLRYVIEYKDFY